MSSRKFPRRSHSLMSLPVSNKRIRSQTWAQPDHPVSLERPVNGESALAPIPEGEGPGTPRQYQHYQHKAEHMTKANVQDEEFRLIIRDVLSSYLKRFSDYDHGMCGRLCTLISDLIKSRIEEVCEEQYKITVNVFVGAIRGDGIDAASQCTWTPDCDRFATASFKNESLFAVGIVFAMYINDQL